MARAMVQGRPTGTAAAHGVFHAPAALVKHTPVQNNGPAAPQQMRTLQAAGPAPHQRCPPAASGAAGRRRPPPQAAAQTEQARAHLAHAVRSELSLRGSSGRVGRQSRSGQQVVSPIQLAWLACRQAWCCGSACWANEWQQQDGQQQAAQREEWGRPATIPAAACHLQTVHAIPTTPPHLKRKPGPEVWTAAGRHVAARPLH